MAPQVSSLLERAGRIEWYHTLELAPGVITPGWLDHRPIVEQVPLPRPLTGMRCLDVGTFNGFWAFAIYDKQDRTLTLARDQMGVRPLYYWHDRERTIASSLMRTGVLKLAPPLVLRASITSVPLL